jgi:acetyl/propionyl-CoA carboxylase alpha subunit
MVHAADRPAAIARLRRALDETEIDGVQTTLPFHRFVAASAAFQAGDLSTDFVETHWDGPMARRAAVHRALLAAGLAAFESEPTPALLADQPAGLGWPAAARAEAIDRWPR